MRIKKLLLISGATIGLVAVVSGAGYAYQSSRQQIDTIVELNRACQHNKDQEGYGNVTLAGASFIDQKGSINNACKVHIKPGSTFQMTNIQVETKDFVVLDLSENAKVKQAQNANHIVLNRITLRGREANFQINLGNPASSIDIRGSTLDYSKSLVIGVGEGDADNKASLTVLGNTMRSVSDDSKGIILVTTGLAQFIENTFTVNKSTETALLLGGTCEFKNNINANDRCHGDQEVL